MRFNRAVLASIAAATLCSTEGMAQAQETNMQDAQARPAVTARRGRKFMPPLR